MNKMYIWSMMMFSCGLFGASIPLLSELLTDSEMKYSKLYSVIGFILGATEFYFITKGA